MAGGVKVDSFEDAESMGNSLKEIVEQIINLKADMMSKVDSLCDAWQSAASQHYGEEFTAVAGKIDTLGEMATQLSDNVVSYMRDAAELDARHANS